MFRPAVAIIRFFLRQNTITCKYTGTPDTSDNWINQGPLHTKLPKKERSDLQLGQTLTKIFHAASPGRDPHLFQVLILHAYTLMYYLSGSPTLPV